VVEIPTSRLHPRRKNLPLADLEAFRMGSPVGEEMICSTCENKTRVVMTRKTEGEIWNARFRACDNCNTRFWTYEIPSWDIQKNTLCERVKEETNEEV
jgi:hypothetical protein